MGKHDLIEKIKKHKENIIEYRAQIAKVVVDFETRLNEIKRKIVVDWQQETFAELDKYLAKLDMLLIDEDDRAILERVTSFDAIELADSLEPRSKRLYKLLRAKR